MSNSVIKWTLRHSAEREKVEALAAQLGFVQTDEDENIWTQKVSQGTFWRETKLRMRNHEVIIFMYKADEYVTETYFEYLCTSGFLVGKLAARMEMLDVVEDLVVEEDNYDPDLDDQTLDGMDED